MAKKRRKRGAPKGRRPESPIARAHRRALRFAREQPAAPLRRGGQGWILEFRDAHPIHFLPKVTQFEWPSAHEIELAGREARVGRRMLEVAADSEAERRLAAGRLRMRPNRRTTQRDFEIALARGASLLKATGIRAMATKTNLLILDEVECHVAAKADAVVMEVGKAETITLTARSTTFPTKSLSDASRVGISGGGAEVVAEAGSALERDLFSELMQPIASRLREQKNRERETRLTMERREQQQRAETRLQLVSAIERLAWAGTPIRLEERALLFDGFSFGEPRIDPEGATIEVGGRTIDLLDGEAFVPYLNEVAAALRNSGRELAALGVPATVTRDGVLVEGTCIAAPISGVPELKGLVAHHALEGFERFVADRLRRWRRFRSFELSADHLRGVVNLFDESFHIGHVDPMCALIGKDRLEGPFTRGGSHWNDLSRLVRERLAHHEAEVAERARETDRKQERLREIAARRESATARIRMEDAPSLPADLRHACMQASTAIRTARTAAYSNPVSLTAAGFRLTFDPVHARGREFSVHFMYDDYGRKMRGRLFLSGHSDPLPVEIEGDATEQECGRAWAAVLLGFEALTVFPEFVEDFVRPSRRMGVSRDHAGVRPARQLPRMRRRSFGNGLFATGWTATAHWVAGHIRLLPYGHQPSSDAEREAASVGISLRSGQTWVRPHVRGGLPNQALTFDWDAPATLVRLHGL
jgi:hypothetical protein